MENELIKITVKNEQQLVSARDLHKGLNVKKRFSVWVDQNFKDFDEGTDWTTVPGGTVVKSGNGTTRLYVDYALTLDMAKELCMMSHTELGKKYRRYFIEVEKKYRQLTKPSYMIEDDIERAERWIEERKAYLKAKQKADYCDSQMLNPGLMTITEIAKNYGWSARMMNAYLHNKGVIFKKGKNWVLYQKYAKSGYAQYEPFPYNGNKGVHNNLKWTQRGKKFIYDLLAEDGIHPILEQMNLLEG
jgi:anti-repressor protein